MSLVYYNEIDAYCAAWLRNLMDARLLPRGDIDTRSIEDVRPDELRGYQQCHFFAGIGGWHLALNLAGWGDRPVWTGSCPCQPFSAAGKGLGFADQRHLWPAWFHLIQQCRPATIFGEQVAAAVGHAWLDGVCADLEGQGYAIGAAVLPACAAGAPHRRDRLWFVADTDDVHAQGIERSGANPQVGKESCQRSTGPLRVGDCVMAHTDQPSAGEERQQRSGKLGWAGRDPWARHSWITGHDGKARRVEPGIRLLAHGVSSRVGRLRAYGNAIVPQVAAEFVAAYMEAVAAMSPDSMPVEVVEPA